jgi:hypothetical protein
VPRRVARCDGCDSLVATLLPQVETFGSPASTDRPLAHGVKLQAEGVGDGSGHFTGEIQAMGFLADRGVNGRAGPAVLGRWLGFWGEVVSHGGV